MKIIKPGKLTQYEQTCPDCGCVFQYDKQDVCLDYMQDTIYCPYCNKRLPPECTPSSSITHHGYVMIFVCEDIQGEKTMFESTSVIFDTREEAEESAKDYPECVGIGEVTWEEHNG